MADLLNTLSGWLKKLKQAPRPEFRSEPQAVSPNPKEPATAVSVISEDQLRQFDEKQLTEFVAQQSERGLMRILQSQSDAALALRIIQGVNDEATLKRVARSGLSKKLKRAAEKKLSTTGQSGMKLRLQKLARVNEQMQAFFLSPKWADAQELLSLVFSPDLLDGPVDESATVFTQFQKLRARLKNEVDAYERTCAEMKDICDQLDPLKPISKSTTARLQSRWSDLVERYAFPKDFELFRQYEEILAARAAPRAPAAQAAAPKPVSVVRDEQQLENEKKKQDDRKHRLAEVENLLSRLRAAEEEITHRKSGPLLRELQHEINALRRWKHEFPAALAEAEALLKKLTSKRNEAVDEGRWDAWARTDLAIRIQTELERIIGGLEAEQDPEIALRNSVGLASRLRECAKEMRALGSLERDKDHKIWQQFNSLIDRGWVICDRMRSVVFEKVKAIFSEHAAKPIEFTSAALSDPRAPVPFLPTAFTDGMPDRIKALRSLWLEIGAKPSEASREIETVYSKLFEMYFRQMNLRLGQAQRSENAALELKRELLRDMKIACEGKSTLLSRARVAKGLEEKWTKAPAATSDTTELEKEFGAYQAILNDQLKSEIEGQLNRATTIRAQVQEVLDRLLAKNEANIPQTLKLLSESEADLLGLEKSFGQIKELFFNNVKEAAVENFQDAHRKAMELILECKTMATKETNDRAQQRSRVLLEAEELALSTDWAASQARFEELRTLWKTMGVLGQKQDAMFGLLFENVCRFYHSRLENRERAFDAGKRAECFKAREEVIYSLEALARFRNEPGMSPLPFSDDEMRTKAPAKMLEYGIRYKHILSLDPMSGPLKETQKLMKQWADLEMVDDEFLPAFWKFYLDRVHVLLGLRG